MVNWLFYSYTMLIFSIFAGNIFGNKMTIKSATLWLLGFGCFTSALALTTEEKSNWFEDLDSACGDCKSSISQDSYEILQDNPDADNEEIREYELCVFKCVEYYQYGKLNDTKIVDDYNKYAKSENENTRSQAKRSVNLCKDNAEEDGKPDIDVIRSFVDCLADQCKT